MKLSALGGRLPWSIIAAAVLLMGAGCLGLARCEELTDGGGRLLRQQAVWVALALLAMLVGSLPSYRLLCRYSYLVYGVALVFLMAVYFAPAINGAHRWLRLGPIGVQPSELMKVALVMTLARWLMHRDNYRHLGGLVAPLLLVLVPVALILREPDLGTSLVLLPMLAAMLLAAGTRLRHLSALAVIALVALPLLWIEMSREQKTRVTAVLTPTGATDRPDDDHYHLHRAKQTLSVGGAWGSWLRERRGEHIKADDDPGAFLVPEAATDSIICVLAERYGLWGLALVFALYWVLVWRILAVARATQEPYGRLLCVGVASLIAVQVLINTGMMVGLVPITGLPLPLVSYGGSELIATALALGLVLNVALRPGYEIASEPFRYVERRPAA